MLYLWDVRNPSGNLILLQFYDSSAGEIKKFSISHYRPYFLAAYPLSKGEKDAMASFEGEVELIRKRNLFTDEWVQAAKVKAWTPMLLKKLVTRFGNTWESEIEYGRSYIYDNGLVFGAPYTLKEGKFVAVKNIQEDSRGEFYTAFAQERKTAPPKYPQIKEWFNLCHQPIPEIDVDLLDSKKKEGDATEQAYTAFLLARIANIPIPKAYTSRRVSDWIKSMIYTYLRRNDVLIPTSKELRRGYETHRVPGALTIEPKAGIYFNTVVCDFQSLYPSCIDSYNLSYETVDCPHEECRSNRVPGTEHHVCTRRKGFYSLLIGALKDLRIRWFKPLSNSVSVPEGERRLAEAASSLLKLISVASYGVTVRIHGAACPPLAESITAYGRWALETAWKTAEEYGMHPTYGDTDSIFLDTPSPSQVQALVDTVKKRLNLDLAIEKKYAICVLSKAKKAYFGIPEEGPPDLKGLTAIKSNAPKFFRHVFHNCVEILSHTRNKEQCVSAKKEIVAVVHNALKELRERRVNLEDLIYSVQLYHDPNQRTCTANSNPQPYQCALQLIDAGQKLSRRDTVHFVKVKPFTYKGKTFTVKPVNHVKSLVEINVEDYARNLTTALEQTFDPMGIRLEKDTKLTDWFDG